MVLALLLLVKAMPVDAMPIDQISPIALALFLAALGLIPLFMIISTAFLKIAMVLMITRSALGVQQVPPNMAVYSIALATSLFVMAPVFAQMNELQQQHPLNWRNIDTFSQNIGKVFEPQIHFIQQNTNDKVKAHFIAAAKQMWPKHLHHLITDTNPLIAVPAFVISEMQAAFEIGFLIYIPFIVVDLIVSNVLLALGMQMVTPMTISLPLKILLFVLVEGWTKLIDGLIYSYL